MSVAVDLNGRVAVVTGGGRGIGAAIARGLAAAGARVVVSARSAGQIDGVASDLAAAGRAARAVVCDVTDPESVARLLGEAETELGPVEILVNNAGVSSSAPLRSVELAEWNRLMAVNATGTFLCTREALKDMKKKKWGRVINFASQLAHKGAPEMAHYVATKAGVIGFTRSLAYEVIKDDITVNSICPGPIDTPLLHSARGCH